MEIVNLRHVQGLKNALLRGISCNDALAGNFNKKPDWLQSVFIVLKQRHDNK